MALLEVNNLTVSFKTGRKSYVTAIRDVSFSIERGQILCLVGESGCGKSVSANSILRLLPADGSRFDGGEILLNGTDLLKLSQKEMCKVRGSQVTMIFQEPMTSLNPVYTIGTQMIEMLQANEPMSKSEAWNFSLEMLRKVGISAPEERMKAYPHQLSGGMRQRVMIAMALSTNPALLIADEPTTALDVTIQAQVFDLMKNLIRELGTSVLLITHDMGVVAEMADQVAVMYAGEVVEYNSVENIFNHPHHPYTMGLLKSIPRVDEDVDELFTIDGIVPPLNRMPTGCRFAERCLFCQASCVQNHPDMTECGEGLVRCPNALNKL